LCTELTGWARERDANCLVTVCPLCQANLDLLNLSSGKNGSPGRLPVLYFTQLVGLALGCSPQDVGMQHGLAPMTVEALPLPMASGRN